MMDRWLKRSHLEPGQCPDGNAGTNMRLRIGETRWSGSCRSRYLDIRSGTEMILGYVFFEIQIYSFAIWLPDTLNNISKQIGID